MIVATVRALKYHGGADLKTISQENLAALEKGLANLERHVENVQKNYGIPCVVSINRFNQDTAAEIELLKSRMAQVRRAGGPRDALGRRRQGRGRARARRGRAVRPEVELPLRLRGRRLRSGTRSTRSRRRVYRAGDVTADAKVRAQIKKLQDDGYGHYPICVAKTQYSFATDPQARAAPTGHVVNVREVRLAAGAEFIVMICGDVMTMPGLPKVPSAERIDIVDGKVVGLF